MWINSKNGDWENKNTIKTPKFSMEGINNEISLENITLGNEILTNEIKVKKIITSLNLDENVNAKLYPIEKLEERRNEYYRINKQDLYYFGLHNNISMKEIDYICDFIEENPQIEEVTYSWEGKEGIKIYFWEYWDNEKMFNLTKDLSSWKVELDFDRIPKDKIKFFKIVKKIYEWTEQGIVWELEHSFRCMLQINKLNQELAENIQMDISDELLLANGWFPARAKRLYYEFRDIFEKHMWFNDTRELKHDFIDKEEKSNWKIILYLGHWWSPEKMVTPFGTFKSFASIMMSWDSVEWYIDDLKSTLGMEQIDKYQYKIEIDY